MKGVPVEMVRSSEECKAIYNTSALTALGSDGDDFTAVDWANFDDWHLEMESEQEVQCEQLPEMLETFDSPGEPLGAMVNLTATEYCEQLCENWGNVPDCPPLEPEAILALLPYQHELMATSLTGAYLLPCQPELQLPLPLEMAQAPSDYMHVEWMDCDPVHGA